MKVRELNVKGEFDYDFEQDILFFKAKNREYDRSIELDNMVIDVDSENFITGIQIFDASEFLKVDKVHLLKVPRWKFTARFQDNTIELRLAFEVVIRNRIVEKNPIIIQSTRSQIQDSQLVAVTA